MVKPLVSIVIPVYNGANYLKEAIDSALSQTYENCEVIVVNDGSIDGGKTEAIALSYGDKIRYIYKENGGVATAINEGIKRMRGEYFAWLSHDDVYYPNKIQRQIEALYESGDMRAIVHCNYDLLEMSSGKKTHVNWLNQHPIERLTNGNFAPVFLCIHGCSVLIHRSHFERIGLYDEKLIATQDSVFLFHVMRGQKSIFVKDNLFIGRIHKEQGSQTLDCHENEYNQMFIYFCEELTDKEKMDMCGTVYNFYYRLYVLLKDSPKATFILGALEEKLKSIPLPKNTDAEIIEFHNMLEKASQGKAKQICLFGAGQYGRRLMMDLKNRGVSINYFIDNAQEKDGTKIEGIPCYGPYKLYEERENTLVIVSMLYEDEVINQLNEMSIPYRLSYSEISKIIFEYAPMKVEYN